MGIMTERFGQGTEIVTIHSQAAFTTPNAANSGTDVSSWVALHGSGPTAADISLSASAACTLPGPQALWITKADGTVEQAGGPLNDGADIIIPNTNVSIGFRCNVGGATKLQIAPPADASNPTGQTLTATNSATITVKATPIWQVVS